MEEPSEEPQQNELPCLLWGQEIGSFKIGNMIAEGGYGRVYHAHDPKMGNAALKAEMLNVPGGSSLKMEKTILLRLRGHRSFPQYYMSGKNHICNYLAMELLGFDLKHLMDTAPDCRFSPKTWSRIGIQMLYAVKAFHSFGYVHRDIKLENFALTLDRVYENPHIKIIDFGLAREFVEKILPSVLTKTPAKETYVDDNGFDRPYIEFPVAVYRFPRQHPLFRGTHLTAPYRAYDESELGRGDDVISVMYVLANIVEPLPWSYAENDQLYGIKKSVCISDLFAKLNNGKYGEKLKEIDVMLQKADYFTPPDYWMVYTFLKQVMDDSGASWTSEYEWKVEYAKTDFQPTPIRFLQRPPWEVTPEVFKQPDFPNIIARPGAEKRERRE